MVGNPLEPSSTDSKTTLLVLPSSVLPQWRDEIKLHVKKDFFRKIMQYKASAAITMENLVDQDILSESLVFPL